MGCALYNGKSFPEYTFEKKDLSYFFVEFDTVFTDEFLLALQHVLTKNGISTLVVENINPEGYLFKVELPVNNLIDSFKDQVLAEKTQTYINTPVSFSMITESGLIYSNENESLFCLILDRRHWLAILGFSNPADVFNFNNFSIKDVVDYLTAGFVDQKPPDRFFEVLYENWH
jgi:hypothetical protein